MHLTLPESSHRRSRTAGGTFLSALLHAAAIGAAVAGTAASAPRPVARDTLEKLVFVKPPTEDPAERTIAPPEQRVNPTIYTPPVVRPPDLVPPTISIDHTVIPTELPDLTQVLGGVHEGRTVASTSSSSGGERGAGGGVSPNGAPLSALAVDEEVVVRTAATPRYPSMLASAGIEGVVLARFVVDTLGRVERGSIEIASDSHELFARSVREALGRMRFEPAKVRGRKVRQLVQQPFTFEITRR